MTQRSYPRIVTVRSEDPAFKFHLFIEVHYSENEKTELFCGDSWCSGTCGHPAAIIPATLEHSEFKMYSNMTACGNVMQRWRVTWTGPKVEVPVEHHRDFMQRIWW